MEITEGETKLQVLVKMSEGERMRERERGRREVCGE